MTSLIELNIPYAHALATELLSRFPAHIDRKDVLAAAEFGLVQAANAFDAGKGVAFTTFAYYRIRGAVFDLLRDTVKASRFEEAANEYMADYSAAGGSRAPSYDDVKNLATTIVASYFLSLESLPQEPRSKDDEAPLDALLRQEQQKRMREALAGLPEKNRRVLEAYYFEDLTLDEIGKSLGLSKSWVSRMHARGLEMLRAAVEQTVSKKADNLKSYGSAPGAGLPRS